MYIACDFSVNLWSKSLGADIRLLDCVTIQCMDPRLCPLEFHKEAAIDYVNHYSNTSIKACSNASLGPLKPHCITHLNNRNAGTMLILRKSSAKMYSVDVYDFVFLLKFRKKTKTSL